MYNTPVLISINSVYSKISLVKINCFFCSYYSCFSMIPACTFKYISLIKLI